MAQDKIGFGIIGGGMIAEFHAKGAAESEKGKIVAAADVNIDIARKFTEKAAPDAKPYGSVDEMLKDPDVQVVCICTPSGMHSDLAVKAAQAGKHVLTEKPLDITSAKMTKMITACRNQEVKLGVVLQRRSFEASRKSPTCHKAHLEMSPNERLDNGSQRARVYMEASCVSGSLLVDPKSLQAFDSSLESPRTPTLSWAPRIKVTDRRERRGKAWIGQIRARGVYGRLRLLDSGQRPVRLHR